MHPFLPPQIFPNHCFQFLLGITVVPREIEDNGSENFLGVSKLHYVPYRNVQQLFLV